MAEGFLPDSSPSPPPSHFSPPLMAGSSNSTSYNPGATRISCRHPWLKSCNKNILFTLSNGFVIFFTLSNNLIIIFGFFVTYKANVGKQ